MSATSFSAAWLQQREPFDTAARQAAALQLDEAAAIRALPRPGGVLRIADLGAGLGANLRYLAPRLGGTQHWQVLDHDAALLQAWPPLLSSWALRLGGHATTTQGSLHVVAPGLTLTVERRRVDLSQPLPAGVFAGCALVTASALLDLMSADAMARLIERGHESEVAWWFALSVDGRIGWPSPDVDDAFVAEAYARHQRGDKGFGPALGAQAPALAAQRLRERGYRLCEADSDWHLDAALSATQIGGMAEAAAEARPESAQRIDAWRARRLAVGGSVRVGHQELIALPR
jgi:hypothetical protein